MTSAGRGEAGRRRTAARLAAVQALYQIELTRADAVRVIAEFQAHRLSDPDEGQGLGPADPWLFERIVRGVFGERANLDRMIAASLAAGWSLERLEAILRAILRAGSWELMVNTEVPAAVIISEYLDIAHGFFQAREPAFVNGVLDRLAKLLRAEELEREGNGGRSGAR